MGKWRDSFLERLEASKNAAAQRKQIALNLKSESKRNLSHVATDAPVQIPIQNDRNIEALVNAASDLKLYPLKQDQSVRMEHFPLNRPTLEILENFFRVLYSGESSILLQWPASQRDVSMIHSLAMISLFTPKMKKEYDGKKYCDQLDSFRSLYFPWFAGRSRSIQKSMLIQRDVLLSWNRPHLTRTTIPEEILESETNEILVKLHKLIGHLQQLKKVEKNRPHLSHPTLAEIYPMFKLDVNEYGRPHIAQVGELFERVKFGATIEKQIDYRPDLSEPNHCPFGLFGVKINTELRQALAAIELQQNPTNICILDLSSTAINRLGHSWSDVIRDFINECKKRIKDMPFFGVTDETFVQNQVAKILRKTKGIKKPSKPIAVRLSSDPITNDPKLDSLSEFDAKFNVVAGEISEAIISIKEAAKAHPDPNTKRKLFFDIGNIREAASLPCGFADAMAILKETYNQEIAELFLGDKSAATILDHLENSRNIALSGNQQDKLFAAHNSVNSFYEKIENETPIGSMLAEIVGNYISKSDGTLIVFNSEPTEVLGTKRLINDPNFGNELKIKIENSQFKFTNKDNLEECLEVIVNENNKNNWKRIIIVAPNLSWMSKIVVERWLPQEFIIICERTFALKIGFEYENLGKYRELSELESLVARFDNLYKAAKEEAERKNVDKLDLELETTESIDLPETVIDLTKDDTENETEIIELQLESNRTLRVRPSTSVIRLCQGDSAKNFEKVNARDIQMNDVIVVPDKMFVSQAREILPVQVLAKSLVEVYHRLVEVSLDKIPGENLTSKARFILEKIISKGSMKLGESAVIDWLNVKKHKEVDLVSKRPHAPQNWKTFKAFMSIICDNEVITEKIWVGGIQSLRIDRRRAGQRMANAFFSVIVDPHGSAFSYDIAIKKKIFQLQTKALEHTDQVSEITVKEN